MKILLRMVLYEGNSLVTMTTIHERVSLYKLGILWQSYFINDVMLLYVIMARDATPSAGTKTLMDAVTGVVQRSFITN